MHLIREIFVALLDHAMSLLGIFKMYVLALAGGQRGSLLTRLGVFTGLIGAGTLYLATRTGSTLGSLIVPLAYGSLAVSALLLIIAIPNVKRTFGYAGVALAAAISIAYFIGYGGYDVIVLAASIALVSISTLLIDDRYLTGCIRGAVAEWRVHQVLRQYSRRGGRLFANAVFPNNGLSVEVDHILINHSGVFVIETKGLSGVIDGDQREDYWRQVLRRTENKFLSPIKQVSAHARLLSGLVGDDIPVHSIVVFTNARFARAMPPNVIHIKDLRRFLKQFNDQVMDDRMINVVAQRIEVSIDSSRAARDMHIRRAAAKRITEYAD